MNEGIYVYENSWFSECKFFPHLQQNNLESRQRIIVLAVNKCKNVNIIFNVICRISASSNTVLISPTAIPTNRFNMIIHINKMNNG